MRFTRIFPGARWLGVLAMMAPAAGLALYVASCIDNGQSDPTCPNYCTGIMSTCTGGDQQYPDEPTCERICASMAPGTPGKDSADTVACRMLQLSAAKDAPTPGEKHADCVAAGVTTSLCGSGACATFCNADLALCTGTNAAYNTLADCQSACASWGMSFDGGLLGATGDTLQCRTYHFELSQSGQEVDLAANRATHCPHTAAASTVCRATPGADSGAPDAGAADAAVD